MSIKLCSVSPGQPGRRGDAGAASLPQPPSRKPSRAPGGTLPRAEETWVIWSLHKILNSASNGSFFLFFKLIFWSILLYNVVLVSIVQQSESAIHMQKPRHFWFSFPYRSSQSTEQFSMLCLGSH